MYNLFPCLTDTQRAAQCVCLCMCLCVCVSFSPSLTTWLSGPERNWDTVFLGHLASGTMPSQPQSEQTWRQTHTHTHVHAPAQTPVPLVPLRCHTHIQVLHNRAPLMCIYTCTSMHAHMHTHTQTHSLCHPLANPFSLCVEWEEGSPQNRLSEKRALPSLRDKHHSVTRCSGHCFLTVLFSSLSLFFLSPSEFLNWHDEEINF